MRSTGACLLHTAVCAAQTPEQQKMWDAQRAQAQADEKARAEKLAAQRAARKADPMAWVRTLNPLAAGGWQFRAVAPDGSWASFSTEHQMKRSGHLVTAWLREEYPEPQRSGSGGIYLSYVEKIQYDCANERARALVDHLLLGEQHHRQRGERRHRCQTGGVGADRAGHAR